MQDLAKDIINKNYKPEKDIGGYEIFENFLTDRYKSEVRDLMSRFILNDIVSFETLVERFKTHTPNDRDDLEQNDFIGDLYRKSVIEKSRSTDEDVSRLSNVKYKNALREEIYQVADHVSETFNVLRIITGGTHG